jgi:hypothetical protein
MKNVTSLTKIFTTLFVLTALLQSPVLATYETTVNSFDPVSYWSLGESTGTTAYDSTTSGIDGTYNGGVQLGVAGAITDGTDTAANFDGCNDYLLINHNDDFLINEGTIQLWAKDTGPSGTEFIFSKDSSGYDTGGHLGIYKEAGTFNVRLQSTDNDYMLQSAAVSTDEWYMLTLTFGSSGMQLYVNDTLVDTDSYTGGLGTSSGGTGNYEPIAIGANTWASGNLVADPLSNFFSGAIDNVAIYDAALSQQNISTLYSAGTIPEPATFFLMFAGAFFLFCCTKRQTNFTYE